MEPEKAQEMREWFQKARNDLRGAEIDLSASPPLLEDVMFHCQQAAEKAMKGFLTGHDRPFPKTHDLDELGTAVQAIDASLASALDRARDLTPFAWRFRYPGTPSVPAREEAEEALAVAREVYQAILDRLPEEVRP